MTSRIDISAGAVGGVRLSGTVESVHLNPAHTLAKRAVETIELVEGLGVKGDAHCGATVQHRSRVRRDPAQPNLRQVHLIHAELLGELAAKGFQLGPGQMGENITTRSIDILALPKNAMLRIGGQAVVLATGLRNPCSQLEAIQKGLMSAVLDRNADGQLIRKAGIMAIVIQGGAVQAGDPIRVHLPPYPHQSLQRV